MRSVVLALIFVAGCHDGDPCRGHDGTCVGLEIRGNGVSSLDQLRFSVTLPGLSAPLVASSPPVPGRAVTLPAHTALYFAGGMSGLAQIAVEGELQGSAIASGMTSVKLGGHAQATVTLDPLHAADAAVDDLTQSIDLERAAGDLAAADQAVAPARDLSTEDLTSVDMALQGCPTGAMFCDDFENETTGFKQWDSPNTSGSNVSDALDDLQPFLHGTQSFHVMSKGGTFFVRKSLPPLAVTMAIRFYFYASDPPGPGANYLDVTDDTTHLSLGVTGSGSTDWQISTGSAAESGGAITVNSWRCVELDLNLVANSFTLYDSAASLHDSSSAPVLSGTFNHAPYSIINLGVYGGPTSDTADVWFDDVAVGATHLGCE